MMGELIFRNLLHRPMRTLIGAMGIALEVALVVLIVGLTSGLLSETAKRIEGIGADIMLQPPNTSYLFAFGTAPMPIKIGDKLAELKYVKAVAPVLFQFNTSGVEIVYGIDPESFRAVSGGFVFLQGHDLEGPEDILVDDIAAKTKKIQPGDTFRIFDHDWHVAGVVEHGKGSRLFVPLATLQELALARDKASIFFLKCTRPEHTEDVMEDMRHVLPNYTVRPLKDYLSLMTSTNIPGLQTFIDAMIALAVCIGLLVIFLTMYTTVIERTRDIGVLKSLGANHWFVVRALLSESAALCLLGVGAGVGLSYLVRAGFLWKFPSLTISITTGWVLRAAGIALVGALLGASYPAWMASRKDAVEALSYD
ncbi:MAG TPA: ABC transporter permease [Candidatus Acidoferrum sp.]|jgi:putative ABC transport system permease protein|nr:ABC transporter permease [Candidatus Acidoferrum sp.]